MTLALRDRVRQLQQEINLLANDVKALKNDHEGFRPNPRPSGILLPVSPVEMIANATLAYRHLQDAASRLERVIEEAEEFVDTYE